MSLESKIDLLIKAVNEQTTAINAFNGNIEKWLTSPTEELTQEKVVVTEEVQTVAQADEPEPRDLLDADAPSEFTHKDVQDAVLAFVRKDVKTNKPKVKALLDKYGASKVSDLEETKLVEFKKQLDTL